MKYTNIDIVETLETYSRINIRGIELLVSNIDIPRLTLYRWYPDTQKISYDDLYYFRSRVLYNGEYKQLSMHRFILELFEYDGIHVVDHINMNSKDNRRENLRIVNHSINSKNCRKGKIVSTEVIYQHYTKFDRINSTYNKDKIVSNFVKIPEMDIVRKGFYTYDDNSRETIVQIDASTYKILIKNCSGVSRRNKFGYPGLSYDKHHKKIAVIHETIKYGFFSDIVEALKKAYEVYNIPYEISKL